MPVYASVLFASDLSDEAAAQLIEDFQSVGVTAELRQVSPRRALGEIAWLALAVVQLKPFFDQLISDFADDAHQHLKTLIARLFRLHRPPPTEPPRVLLLQDSTTGIQIVLEPDLPPVPTSSCSALTSLPSAGDRCTTISTAADGAPNSTKQTTPPLHRTPDGLASPGHDAGRANRPGLSH